MLANLVSDLNIQECAISGYEALAGTFDQGKIMILYHFTGLEFLDAIMEDGLSKGDVPTSATEGLAVIWRRRRSQSSFRPKMKL
jgi:RNA:NAD 2'-phosphotransferase (TPT1/KptA family)